MPSALQDLISQINLLGLAIGVVLGMVGGSCVEFQQGKKFYPSREIL